MIKSLFGIIQEPFNRSDLTLLSQQKKILDIIKIHSQQGGFSVIIGNPGVGKSVLKEHIEDLQKERDITVVSCSRTLHTYLNILKQLAESFKIEMPVKDLEKELIKNAFNHIRERKTLYILIDEAHLLDMQVLRKLRLLFERFIHMDVMYAGFAGAKTCPQKTQLDLIWTARFIVLLVHER